MGSNMEEAVRAKAFAEKQFVEKDFVGAKKYALKAQKLCPELEGISQMVVTFGVYNASGAKINGEHDFYSILGLDPSADKSKIKRQYKKMAVLLHPDKNKTIGADGAFRLVSEAWTLLSDSVKRSSYDQRRTLFTSYSVAPQSRSDTFWTVCTSCHVQYEYLRKYVNKRLSCKNCRGVFVAVETGLAPATASFPYYKNSFGPENGYACGVTYMPTTTGYSTSNVASSGNLNGHRSDYASNISFQGSSTGSSVGVYDPTVLSASSFVFSQVNGQPNKTSKANGKNQTVKSTSHMVASNGYTVDTELSKPKRGRPAKKRKMESDVNGHEEIGPTTVVEPKIANGNGILKSVPAVDARQLLIKKARSDICRKLGEMKLASEKAAIEAEKRKRALAESNIFNEEANNSQPQLKRTVSMSITVPDPDFHDFDKDRSEDCFKPKQIWAIYDEEDGMPRLYCLIREVISVNPFKIFISYLSSKTDSEFGSVNWLDNGFTKSCGSFRVFSSETIDHVNIFSHLLSREKAGRGGCVRIYPKSGDIWAVYRNWSPDWNRSTPDEIRHKYEMVEVIDDYSEENGVWVTPLIKLDGFKTVYQRNKNTNAVRWIPRREMLRFSHQVPACSLKGEMTNLPEGCWDLDPAATPEELLQGEYIIDPAATPEELLQGEYIIKAANEFTPDTETSLKIQ